MSHGEYSQVTISIAQFIQVIHVFVVCITVYLSVRILNIIVGISIEAFPRCNLMSDLY